MLLQLLIVYLLRTYVVSSSSFSSSPSVLLCVVSFCSFLFFLFLKERQVEYGKEIHQGGE